MGISTFARVPMSSAHLVLLLAAQSAGSSIGLSKIIHADRPAAALSSPLGSLLSLRGGATKCDVWLIGCGVPKRGMGWYHAKQILEGDIDTAQLTAVVEPWFLGNGAESPPGQTFGVWAKEMAETYGTTFCKSIDELEVTGPTLALISGRTADNPRLLKEVIDKGVSAVYLEKPGAPTVAELEEMREYAKSKGVPVYMGYNKNVTPYVRKALEEAKKCPGSQTTYVHNNAYTIDQLPECFERNAEGMLKNMAIHELALLATYWGVTVENIESVTPDADFSSMLTLTGPSGKEFTDFSKIGFTVKTKTGNTITLQIDRCGSDSGGNSIAIVSKDGKEVFRAETPDEELQKYCAEASKADPEMMPYFFLQSDDYKTLKDLATSHVLSGDQGAPEGMATIEIAVEALRVAEYLTPVLQAALKA
uniref:Gfo/Idh/MocA-like oxidoreductase N-terminal domain-containing protein n=1 Tax=Calcidiscus leptoporus TaxID=127549 RepID=A0A7S0J822_9EUKA